MGILGSMVGGAVGAELLQVVQGVIEKNGGVQGLVNQFEQNGLGGVAQSWVSNGPNQPVTPSQVGGAIGQETVNSMAANIGMTPDQLLKQLSTLLPKAIDQMTPNGKVE